ncbi:HAD family hydrolase [Paenibacillus elgii]|uniref:HAD family hydrolase n=1 Tax=Paenibacillus elgii TaxID=189691 RepID=UPI00203B6CCF|nr:HAD family hydrolase [Paenibacillus elgii]MCM3273697.1 HAD family hydrolase [Paenibacillus elgii]
MYPCLLFDVDGTLLDTEQAILSSLSDLLRERNIPFEPEDLAFVLGIPSARSLPRFGIQDIEEAANRWNRLMERHDYQIRVFEGIEPMLRRVKKLGLRTGIVTSKTRTEYIKDFGRFDLHPYFDVVVCADDTARHKPHPEPILTALKRLEAEPKDAMYIGDSIYDMQCAAGAGVASGLALWGAYDAGIAANYRLRHPNDILKIMEAVLP